MTADGWRYIAARPDGVGGLDFLDLDVPLSGVEVEDLVSGDSSLTATISPEYLRLKTPDNRPLFDEWNTAIFAEHDGDLRGGGLLTHSGFDGPDWKLEVTGYTGYLSEMPYTGPGKHYEEVDAADIFREIWDHVQSQRGGNLGLQVSDFMSGITVGTQLRQAEFDTENGPVSFEVGPYKLNRYSDHDLSDNVVELATVGQFDWRERHYWLPDGTIAHELMLGHLGRRRTDLRFVVGENIDVIPNVERDGELYADEVLVLGAGEGSAQRAAIARRNTGRLRRVAVVVDPSLRSNKQARLRAEAEVAWRNDIADISEVVLRDHPHAATGAVEAGDEIRIQGDLGWNSLDTWVRVLGRKIRPDDSNTMALSVARSNRLVS